MQAIKQKCRPKHQVLVLKCYPRVSKGAVDVKPNSSELSYLLFYATSRRSKIQKIGAFLEKKTASDVWRLRVGNVQVTLGILAALIEKSPKDVALIAPCVLKILDLILRSNDISMIESSLPTFEAFCQHHDASPLFADQAYLKQYESVVRAYAALASTTKVPTQTQGALSRPLQARWRNAGLHAIKSVATSEALASVTDRQIDVIVPLILENLWNPDEDVLDTLVSRVEVEDKVDSEKLLRRRTSVGTVDTAGTGDANAAAFSGTPNDADMMAEEDNGVLAMQCLKSIFIIPNRPQINAATVALLKFIFDKVSAGESVVELSEKGKHDSGWAIAIYKLISRWAPVQDRYVILVVAVDTLVHNPIKEDRMEQQVALISIIGSLLRSDINLIGLSVMDVLLGLVNQIRKLFHPAAGVSRSASAIDDTMGAGGEGLASRRLIVDRLERCIGDLATHVYYADQISDMILSVFARLRPAQSPSTTSTPQGEKADANDAGPGASTQDLAESQPSIENYFTYNKGRVSALRVIKNILSVANPKLKMSGHMNLSRSRVPLRVWEGTHWLLRDPDGEVRKAYVDAFCTWLDRETTPADLRAKDDTQVQQRSSIRQTRDLTSPSTAQRAVSNASQRESRGRRPLFLPQLHLSIYDNALQYVDYESDILLLHVLLTKLVIRLGVNVVRYGIPMIYRLQEDIQEMEVPAHKMRIAALCHGYFWILTEKFDFEGSSVGRAIHNEIVRRRNKRFWVDGINVPPPLLSAVGMPGQIGSPSAWDATALETEELLPFDDRSSLVECIATGYEQSSRSPPSSPAVSPNRTADNPILSVLSSPPSDQDSDFPSAFREQMQTDWSRESAVSALAAEGRAESLNGSKTGTSTTRNRLTINTMGLNGNGQMISPYGSPRNLRPQSARYPGDRERYASESKLRKSSVRSGIAPSVGGSARGGVASVDQLKMVLSGDLSARSIGLVSGDDDDSGESLVSFDYSPSELSFNPPSQQDQAGSGMAVPKRSASGSRRGPLSSNPPHQRLHIDDNDDHHNEDDDVPPVPPIPQAHSPSPLSPPVFGNDVSVQDHATKTLNRKLSSKGGSLRIKHDKPLTHEVTGKSLDLQELLLGLDSRAGEGSLGNITKPPY